MQLLKKLRCDYGQGYLFSCPMPAEEATQLLEENRQGHPLILNKRPCDCEASRTSLSFATG
jgi:hypothetical protein